MTEPMKIVICWSNVTSYWAALWKELGDREGIELYVIAFEPPRNDSFSGDVLAGIEHRLLNMDEVRDYRLIADMVESADPDVLIVVGWFVKSYRQLVKDQRFSRVCKLMSVDTQWKNEFQYLTRLRYKSYFSALNGAGVSGERSFQYVRRLGFSQKPVDRWMYGVDSEVWTHVYKNRARLGRPRKFLFVGRYVEEKALPILAEAYRIYRRWIIEPWPLVCCGAGPEQKWIQNQAGVTDLGFTQPENIPGVFQDAAVLVLSSKSDEWPLALVEAAISGMPIVATDVCGSAVEIVRSNYNGFIIPPEDPQALAEAMLSCHDIPLDLWGRRAREHGLAFGKESWADRWLGLIGKVRAAFGAAT